MWFPCYENFSEIPRFALFKLQFEWRPFFNTYSRRYRRKSRSPCATFPTGNLSLSLTPPNVVVKTEQGFFILNTNSPDLLLYFYQKKRGIKTSSQTPHQRLSLRTNSSWFDANYVGKKMFMVRRIKWEQFIRFGNFDWAVSQLVYPPKLTRSWKLDKFCCKIGVLDLIKLNRFDDLKTYYAEFTFQFHKQWSEPWKWAVKFPIIYLLHRKYTANKIKSQSS